MSLFDIIFANLSTVGRLKRMNPQAVLPWEQSGLILKQNKDSKGKGYDTIRPYRHLHKGHV